MPSDVYTVLEAAGLNDPQPQFLTVDTAVVAYALPALNAYYVIPSQNMSSTGNPVVLTAFATNGPCLKYGASVAESYVPGTMVIIVTVGVSSKGDSEGENMAIILGSVPRRNIENVGPYQNRYILPGVPLNYDNTPFAESLISRHENTSLMQDRNYGRPMEALAGDWSVTNDFLNYILIGRAYAGFGALRARVESHSLHNRLKLTADDLQFEGLGLEQVSRPDMGDLIHYVRRARNIKEGLGVLKGSPFLEDAEGFSPLEEKQQGIFRRETYEGELTEGLWDTLQLPERVGKARSWDKADKAPFGVDSVQTLYNGLHEHRNALQLASVKSPYVPVPRSLEPEKDKEKFPEDDESGKSWQDENKVSEEDYPNVAPANNTEEFDHNTSDFWRKRIRTRTDNWKIFTPDDVESEYGGKMDRRKEMDALDETEQDYDLPPELEVEDPATGEKKKYYSAESFIRQLPDGSISISDGYGAEIRMVRGRIIISSATDTEIRPGRDLHVLSGRHAVINAGDSLFTQASHGSVYSKAEKDYRILAGNSYEGTLTLESRGASGAEAINSNDKENKVDGGVVIKSSSNLGLLGVDVYMGVYDENDESTGGLQRTKKGSMVLDACDGMLGLMGNSLYGTFKRSVTTAVTSGGGSALFLGSAQATMIAPVINMGTSTCLFQSAGKVPVKTMGAGGVVTKSVGSGGGGQTTVYVGGGIRAQQDIKAAGSMEASRMSAGTGAFNAPPEHYGHGGGSSPSVNIPSMVTSDMSSAGTAFEEDVKSASPTLYIGASLLGTGFAYPSAEDLRVSKYMLYATRWQNMLKDPKQWTEKSVGTADDKEDTYIYPGKKHWMAESFFKKVDDRAILETGYIINTKQEA